MADTTIDLLKNSSYVGKMDELIAAVKSGGGTASDVEWDNVKNKPTTIVGYGIIDAKIDNGTITLGNQTITPLTSAPVTSVNSKTGAVTLSASDVSAIPSTLTGTAGQVLTKTADGQEWKDVDIPTQLPNPNALTFTGAATGIYDGSAPLSVEIPSGSGSGGSAALHLLAEGTLTEDAASIDVDGFSADRIAFAVAPYGSTANSGKVNGLFTFGFSDDSSINININMVFVDNTAVKAWNKHIFYATVNGNVLDILATRDTSTWNTDIDIKILSNFAGSLIRRVVLPKTVKITSLSIGLASTGVIGANTQFKVVGA